MDASDTAKLKSSLSCPVCGTRVASKPRSTPQLRRYFKLVQVAYDHLPEGSEAQHHAGNVDEFRKYVQMKAGHFDVVASAGLLDADGDDLARVMKQLAHAAGWYALPVVKGGAISIYVPKSIAYHKLSHGEACKLFDEVSAVIKDVVGVDAETLLKEAEKSA